MHIIFKDGRQILRIDASQKADEVCNIGMRHMILPEPFDALYINLANDVEEVEFYRLSESRRIASMGGASAWHIYKQIREIYPQLSHSAPTVQSFQ